MTYKQTIDKILKARSKEEIFTLSVESLETIETYDNLLIALWAAFEAGRGQALIEVKKGLK